MQDLLRVRVQGVAVGAHFVQVGEGLDAHRRGWSGKLVFEFLGNCEGLEEL